MLKVYGSDLSVFSNKVRFIANILGVEYDYIKVNLRNGEHREADYLKLHPAGKIPAIDDDGFVLFESNAIIKYLAGKAGSKLYPQDLQQRAVIDQWVDFGTLHVGESVNRVVFNRVFAPRIKVPVDKNSIQAGMMFLNRFLPVVDNQLSQNTYLAGNNITLADINLLATLDPAEVADIVFDKYKNIVTWRCNLKNQDFYTKCYKEYGEILKK